MGGSCGGNGDMGEDEVVSQKRGDGAGSGQAAGLAGSATAGGLAGLRLAWPGRR